MNDTVIKIQAYNEFEAGMAKLEEVSNFLPDATTKEGYEKSKRIALDIGKVKSKLEKVRVSEKSYWLEGGRQVQTQAKEIEVRLVNLIEPHKEAYKAVDNAEKLKKQKRQDEATAKIETIAIMIETAEHLDSVGVSELMEQCEQFDTENGLWELTNDGIACKLRVGKKLLDMYLTKQQNEANEKELAELRAKQAIQDQKDHDARIAKQASEQAEKDKQEAIEREEQAKANQLKAEQDKIKTEKRLKELDKQYKIDAEMQKEAAIERARQAKIEAENQAEESAKRARQEEQAKFKAQKEAHEKHQAELEANKRHVGAICKATKESLIQECELDEDTAVKVTKAIAKKLIANLIVQY